MAKEKTTAQTAPRTKKGGEPEQKKLPYEELEKIASQCYAENERLKKTIQEMSRRLQGYETSDFYARLDWLWRVITLEGSDEVFGEEFYAKTVNEFKLLMTPPQQPQEEEKS